MAISIDFLSNVTQFLRGAKDVEGALEAVADSLDDVAADAQRADIDEPLREGEDAADRAAGAIDGVAGSLRDAGQRADAADLEGPLREGEDAAERASAAIDGVQDALGDADGAAGRADLDGPLREGEDAAERASAAIDGVQDALGDADGAAGRADLDSPLRDGEKAADRTADAVQDVADALSDADRQADRAQLDKPLADAKDEGDRLERTFKQLADAAKDTEKAGKNAGDGMRDGMKKADDATGKLADGVGDIKDEADQAAREFGASFSGDPVDALDSLRDIAANALGGFGPLGLAAGVALAAGLGFAQTKLEEIAEKANSMREEAASLAVEMITADDAERVESLKERFDELATSIVDTKEWYEVWQDQAVTGIEVIAAAAQGSGEVVAQFMSAFDTTDPIERQQALADSLDVLKGRAQEMRDEVARIREENTTYATGIYGTQSAVVTLSEAEKEHIADLEKKADALDKLSPEIEDLIEKQKIENDVTKALAESHGLSVEDYKKHQQAEEDLTGSIEAYGDALEAQADPTSVYDKLLQQQQDKARETAQAVADSTADSSDSWEDYVEDAQVSTQNLIDEWNAQAQRAEDFQKNLAIISAAGGDALAQELLAKGPEVAGAVAEVIATSDPATQQAAIDAHTRATGASMVSTMASSISGNAYQIQDSVSSAVNSVSAPPVGVPWALSGDLQWQVDQAARSVRSPYIEFLMQPRVEYGP